MALVPGTWVGAYEIYVRPFPDVEGGRWQVSTGGGSMPLWSRNGRELFSLSPDEVLMGVSVDASSSWRMGVPHAVVTGPYQYIPTNNGRTGGGSNGRVFDISPDGQRFLLMKQGAGAQSAPVNLVLIQNWFEELKRLAPRN